MHERRKSGGTLALTIACMVILVLIGIGFAFLIQIFGAAREGQNAGDSGSLGLAKMGIRRPSIKDSTSSRAFIALKDLGDSTVGGEVNLLTYNRLVGAALLCMLNAQAEGNPEAAASAQALLDELQKGPNSVAGKLQKALKDANAGASSIYDYNLKDEYSSLTDAHYIKMGGANAQSSISRTDYQTGYYTDSDAPASNLRLAGMPTALNFDTGATVAAPSTAESQANGTTYFKGYKPVAITVAGQNLTLYGVANYPGQAPHLISQKDFLSANPGGAAAELPPNAFRNQSQLTQNGKANSLMFDSRGVVGVVDTGAHYTPRIRRGYMIIDNRGTGSNTSFSPTGSSVLAGELGTGIYVFGSYPNAVFSTDRTALMNWSNYNHSGSPPSQKPANAPSTTNVHYTDGSEATWQQAWSIIPKGQEPFICTDLNTAQNPCAALIDPHAPATQGPFDLGYHPGADLSGTTSSGNSLLAVEVAKCKVWEAYYVPPFSACVDNGCSSFFSGINSTGMRLFPTGHVPWQGQAAPWGTPGAGFAQVPGNSYSQPTACQVTTEGTLEQLIDQSFGSGDYLEAKGTAAPSAADGSAPRPKERVKNFLLNRIRQIKPDASDADVDRVMSTTMRMGAVFFIYSDGADQIVCTEAAPPDQDTNLVPDGVLRRFIKKYDLSEVIANSQNDNNIHDHHFMSPIAAGTLYGYNTLAVLPGTGARNGFLGLVKFQNDAGCVSSPPYSANGVTMAAGPGTGDFSLCNRD